MGVMGGVGTDRKSVVMKTLTGQFIVTPDNGTLTLIAESEGIAEIREIDEKLNRRKGSEESYTFHGRDVTDRWVFMRFFELPVQGFQVKIEFSDELRLKSNHFEFKDHQAL